MKKLGITTYNKMRKYESYLTTAHKANYIRGLSRTQLDELIACGKDIDIIYKYNGCPKCVLEFVQRLAVPYFELKQRMEDKKNAKKESNRDKGSTEEGIQG